MFLLLHRLVDNLHEILLKSLLFQNKAILIPYVIRNFGVPSVLPHTPLEQADDECVVWLFGELQFAAIVHEFLEFLRVSLAELIYGDFELLFLNVAVLFVLGSSWETLPGERAS